MQYGYDDELFQAWRDGEIRRKDLPEEVVAMALDLCERWPERSKSGVGASTRRSGSPATPAPLIAAAVAAAPTLAALPCRVVTRGEGTRIEDPSHQDRAGRGHMSLNPISSQSLTVLFIYLFIPLMIPLCRSSKTLFRKTAPLWRAGAQAVRVPLCVPVVAYARVNVDSWCHPMCVHPMCL